MWSFFSRDPVKDFAYEIGDKISGLEEKSLWVLHEGKRKVRRPMYTEPWVFICLFGRSIVLAKSYVKKCIQTRLIPHSKAS